MQKNNDRKYSEKEIEKISAIISGMCGKKYQPAFDKIRG